MYWTAQMLKEFNMKYKEYVHERSAACMHEFLSAGTRHGHVHRTAECSVSRANEKSGIMERPP